MKEVHPATVFVVYARTDDYYDQGQMYSIHATQAGAEQKAQTIKVMEAPSVGTIVETWILLE